MNFAIKAGLILTTMLVMPTFGIAGQVLADNQSNFNVTVTINVNGKTSTTPLTSSHNSITFGGDRIDSISFTYTNKPIMVFPASIGLLDKDGINGNNILTIRVDPARYALTNNTTPSTGKAIYNETQLGARITLYGLPSKTGSIPVVGTLFLPPMSRSAPLMGDKLTSINIAPFVPTPPAAVTLGPSNGINLRPTTFVVRDGQVTVGNG